MKENKKQSKADKNKDCISTGENKSSDKTITILTIVISLVGVMIAMFTIIFGGIAGIGVGELWKIDEIRKRMEKEVKLVKLMVKDIKQDAKFVSNLRKDAEADYYVLGNKRKEKDKELKEIMEIMEIMEKPTDDINEKYKKVNNEYEKINIEYKKAKERYALFGGSLEAENYLISGDNLCSNGKYEEALEDYDIAIELQPTFAEAWIGKGVVYENLKRYEDSLNAYEKAIKLNDNMTEAWIGKGVVFFSLGQYDNSQRAFNKVIKLEPDLDKGWYNLACIFSIKGQKEEALLHLKKAIKRNSFNKTRAEKDKDFENLWEDKGFLALVK